MNEITQFLKEKLHPEFNVDVRIREITNNGKTITMYFLSSLVDSGLVAWLIDSLNSADFEYISMQKLATVMVHQEDDKQLLLIQIFEGNVILVKENGESYVCDVKRYPNRAISYPEVEKSVRGSKDSFNESIIDGIALIRRRIKSETLRVELFVVSEKSKMAVTLIYLEDLCNPKMIEELKRRINNLHLESLIMSDRALEEGIFRQKGHIVPLVRYTERPDVASINLIKGKAIILVDTSCNAIITPISIFDHFKNVEEHKQNPIIGTFTKSLRLIGSLISVFLVPLFILFTIEDGYNNGIIPLYTLEWETPLLFQVVTVSLVLEIIRIAVVHTPNALTSALSLLAAIVIGEVALSIGLFSSEILLVTSIAIVCNFATPSYELSLANRFISIIFIVFTCLFGVKGFLLTFLILFIYLVSVKVLDVPYLYPICPFDFDLFKNLFVRRNSQKKK